ncbi:MAG: DNA photolyase, partial [Desulfobacterales bacterium]|nr:DNA photolyase [Desulfobacterales bacterium]
KPLRINLYQALIKRLKAYASDLLVYFCMEDQEVWEKCLGYYPQEKGGLGWLLDKSAAEKCGLDNALVGSPS